MAVRENQLIIAHDGFIYYGVWYRSFRAALTTGGDGTPALAPGPNWLPHL
jgi:hypothetical protein